jgi:hypothetical protein
MFELPYPHGAETFGLALNLLSNVNSVPKTTAAGLPLYGDVAVQAYTGKPVFYANSTSFSLRLFSTVWAPDSAHLVFAFQSPSSLASKCDVRNRIEA